MDKLIAEFRARGGVVTVVPQGAGGEVVWKRGWFANAARSRSGKELHWVRSEAASRRNSRRHDTYITPVDVHFKLTE